MNPLFLVGFLFGVRGHAEELQTFAGERSKCLKHITPTPEGEIIIRMRRERTKEVRAARKKKNEALLPFFRLDLRIDATRGPNE
jgi:hypothetical protein